MRIAKKKLSKKHILFTSAVFVVIACLSVFALDKLGIISILPKDTILNISKEPTQQEKKSEEKNNQDTKDSFLDTRKDDQKKSVENSKPAPVPVNNSSIELSANKDGSNVTIIAKLKEQGYSQGKCLLIITLNGKKYSQEAEIIYQPEYSTCAGFSVPISSVGNGSWDISLSVTPINGKSINKKMIKDI